MIITLSMVVGALAAGLAYRLLFYDFGDFWNGCGKFSSLFTRRRGWLRRQNNLHPPPEYFDDDSWSSGIRFCLFLALSFGGGYFIYYELHKHFG